MQDSEMQMLKVETETAKGLLKLGAKEGLTWPKMARKVLHDYVIDRLEKQEDERKTS